MAMSKERTILKLQETIDSLEVLRETGNLLNESPFCDIQKITTMILQLQSVRKDVEFRLKYNG